MDHLSRDEPTTYQKIELKIASVSGGLVIVTDDYKHIFELHGRLGSAELSDSIISGLPKGAEPTEFKVKLGRWSFEPHRVGNTKKDVLDITCRNLE